MCINGLSIRMSLCLELSWYPWCLEALLRCPRTDLKTVGSHHVGTEFWFHGRVAGYWTVEPSLQSKFQFFMTFFSPGSPREICKLFRLSLSLSGQSHLGRYEWFVWVICELWRTESHWHDITELQLFSIIECYVGENGLWEMKAQ